MRIRSVKPMTRRAAAGLSRLEILLALIVMAVLSAVLLNRLSELSGMARPARLQAAISAVRAGASVFHARCLTRDAAAAGSDCARLMLDGVPVAGVHRWPQASAQGIAAAARLTLTGADPLRLTPARRGDRPALRISIGSSGCEFFYVQAMSPDESPEVDIVDASCH